MYRCATENNLVEGDPFTPTIAAASHAILNFSYPSGSSPNLKPTNALDVDTVDRIGKGNQRW